MKRIAEADLVLIRQGNNEPLTKIYAAHYQACIRHIIRLTQCSTQDAEDVTMDALLVLREVIMSDRFRNENVQSFLITVGVNKWKNKVKRDRRLLEYDPMVMEELLAQKKGEQQDNLAYLEKKVRIILQAIESIGGKCEKLLQLNLVEGLPLTSIVEELGYASYDVLKTSKSRCMKKLKSLIEKNIG